MMLQNRRRSEKGNILFLILLAVVLFAALSYAVTQSLRGGGQNANSEKNLVKSATITQYPVGVRAAILRMIVGGTSPTSIWFDPPSVFADFSNVTADQALEVFHPSGGGAVFALIPSDALATASSSARWYFNSDFEVPGIGTSTAGEAGNDLIAFADNMDATLCAKINSELGVGSVPTLTGTKREIEKQQTKYDKGNTSSVITYTQVTTGTNHIADNSTPANGVTNNKPYLCVKNGSDGNNMYYHVLVER